MQAEEVGGEPLAMDGAHESALTNISTCEAAAIDATNVAVRTEVRRCASTSASSHCAEAHAHLLQHVGVPLGHAAA